ncbi:MAG: 50S ribosomal protein L13 [Candidatus Omnitrophica bacterium]|nr:50S ribosomal protein L13 [Candidatus Omnitrophota bacterium]
MMNPKTFTVKHDDVPRQWHLIDAEGQVLGRLAVRVAGLLRGKHKPVFTPFVDCGDNVVVINAGKIRVTGNKLTTKVYTRYSGYPSGLKKESLGHLLNRQPTEALHRAVVGMLPKNPLGRRLAKRLRVYAGPEHRQAAQLHKKEKRTKPTS